MNANADQAERLVSQIEEAFSDSPKPEGDPIVLDCDPDSEEVQAFLRDKDWRDLDARALVPLYMDVLPLLTPQAFRFFLPAYMIASVEAHDEADALPDFTAYSLTEPDAQDTFSVDRGVPAMSPQGFRDNVSQFTAAQEEAIRAFLEHMVAAHGNDWAVAALARYWGLEEEVVFDQEGIVVSTARLTVSGRTYCLNRVASARTHRKNPSRAWPIAFFLVGGAPLFELGYIFGGDSAGGFVILMLFFVTLAWCLQAKPRYSVVLDTSSGEARALTSTDQELVETAVHAINQALSHQGGRPQEAPRPEPRLDNARLHEYDAFDKANARLEARDSRSESTQGEEPGPIDAGLAMEGDAAAHGPPTPSRHTLSAEEGQPCCPKCFEPFEPSQDYCRNCGWVVGEFTLYKPLEKIPAQVGFLVNMWKKLWSKDASAIAKALCGIILFVTVPIIFVLGLPCIIARQFTKKDGPAPPGSEDA